jgi:hypothetical protein
MAREISLGRRRLGCSRRHITNRWTGATGSDFRIKRDPASYSVTPWPGQLSRSVAFMPDRMPIEAYFLAAFVGSCVGLGFAAGYVGRRHGWGSWTIGLGSTCVALLWPIVALAAFLLTSRGPCEPPCDAPVYVFTGIVAIVMPLLSLF